MKLNELVAALPGASNRLIEVEALAEDDLHLLERHYHELVMLAKRDHDLRQSHSVDEARSRHDQKSAGPRPRSSRPS